MILPMSPQSSPCLRVNSVSRADSSTFSDCTRCLMHWSDLEIVRRKDFSGSRDLSKVVGLLTRAADRFFAQRAETLAEIMAELSWACHSFDYLRRITINAAPTNARSARCSVERAFLCFPSRFNGWTPTIEISKIGTGELPYKIGREDLTGMYNL